MLVANVMKVDYGPWLLGDDHPSYLTLVEHRSSADPFAWSPPSCKFVHRFETMENHCYPTCAFETGCEEPFMPKRKVLEAALPTLFPFKGSTYSWLLLGNISHFCKLWFSD